MGAGWARSSWKRGGALRNEAVLLAEWLGEDLDVALAQPARGAGMGCVTGGTRKLVVEQMENMWGRVLTKTLDIHVDRRVITFLNA